VEIAKQACSIMLLNLFVFERLRAKPIYDANVVTALATLFDGHQNNSDICKRDRSWNNGWLLAHSNGSPARL
jgi:hypothetical protein